MKILQLTIELYPTCAVVQVQVMVSNLDTVSSL